MTEFRDGRPAPEPPLRIQTGADTPPTVRRKLVDEVRRRLANGELDTDVARMETAFALLDGDLRASR
jgi:hypothetical protein